MSTWAEGFRGGYSPGGVPPHRRRREAARRAGRLSGRRRRQLAWRRRGHAGGQTPSLPLRYEPRQPSRREFDRDYETVKPRPETPQGEAQWSRGRETAWTLVMDSWRLLCVEGQHCGTSKPQRRAGLELRGRGRCERTVQRHLRLLEQLGYATFSHVRTPPGRRDYLRIEWRLTRRLPRLDVSPPSGTVNPGLQPGGSPPSRQEIPPPPSASADDVGPPCGGQRPVTELERARSRISFLEAKDELGWSVDRRELRQLRALVAQATGSPEPPRAGGGG